MSRNSRMVAIAATAALAVSALGSSVALGQDEATECAMTTPDENMAIVVAYVDASNANDAEALATNLHPEFTDNQNRYGLETDDTHNDDEAMLVEMMHVLYPTHENRVDDIYAFDDKVVAAFTMVVGEHTLTADGSAATLDTAVEMPGMGIYTVECGQITSAHTVTDSAALFNGLGIPHPEA
jgi:hypothetical protein